MDIANRAPAGPDLSLFELTMGATLTQGIAIACRLDIPDRLHREPSDVATLAAVTGQSTGTIRRLLLLLRSVGVVTQDGDLFHLTQFGDPLRRGAEPSLRDWALMAGAGWFWGPLGHLERCLEEGRSGFDLEYGTDVFDHLATGAWPDAQDQYDRAMGGAVTADGSDIVARHDLGRRRRLVDIGGGNGSLCLQLLQSAPHLTGTVFDRPAVIERAETVDHPAADRCRWVAGDFWRTVPTGDDVYLLSRILHDWDDRHAGDLLRRIRSAMATDGTLLVIEQLLGEDDRPFTPLCDLNMAALYGTGERTRDELCALLRSADLEVVAIDRLRSGRFLIETRPADGAPGSGRGEGR